MKKILLFTLCSFLSIIISCNNDSNVQTPNSGVTAVITTQYSVTGLNCAHISKDGKYFVATIHSEWPKSPQIDPGTVKLYDFKTGELIREIKLSGFPADRFLSACISPNGKEIAACGTSYSGWFNTGIVIFDFNTGKYITTNDNFGYIGYITYTSSGDSIIAINSTGDLCIWNLKTDKITKYPNCMYFSSNGYFIISSNSKYILSSELGSGDWDISQDPPVEIKTINAAYTSIFPDNNTLLRTSQDEIYLWDLSLGKLTKTIKDINYAFHYATAISRNGKYFATSYKLGRTKDHEEENGVTIWDATTMTQIGKADLKFNPTYMEFGSDETEILYSGGSGLGKLNIAYQKK